MPVQKTFAIEVTHDQSSSVAHVTIIRNGKRFCLRSIGHEEAEHYLRRAGKYAEALEEFLQ